MITPGFTGSPLDRADRLRADPDAISRLVAQPGARLLLLDGLDPRARTDGGLCWDAPAAAPADVPLALLGIQDGCPHFVALGEVPAGGGALRSAAIFALLDRLAPPDAAIYAAARSLVDWHGRNRFCANCGQGTAVFRAGWGRRCAGCRAEHYPRTDPVVIMLAEHGGRVLVGRQPRFPAGRYSALAGFVELGESIEEAVARELAEEAGVVATRVRYLSSQPWPFPSQLMIACVAPVADDAITLDVTELEDAIWVTRDEVAAALAGDPGARFLPPPPYAIAHTLFRLWLAGADEA